MSCRIGLCALRRIREIISASFIRIRRELFGRNRKVVLPSLIVLFFTIFLCLI